MGSVILMTSRFHSSHSKLGICSSTNVSKHSSSTSQRFVRGRGTFNIGRFAQCIAKCRPLVCMDKPESNVPRQSSERGVKEAKRRIVDWCASEEGGPWSESLSVAGR